MDVFIYHLYDWDIREAVVFRDANGLGDFQVFADDCSIAAGFNRDGGRRLALYCIPDSDCGGDYFSAFEMRKREASDENVGRFFRCAYLGAPFCRGVSEERYSFQKTFVVYLQISM